MPLSSESGTRRVCARVCAWRAAGGGGWRDETAASLSSPIVAGALERCTERALERCTERVLERCTENADHISLHISLRPRSEAPRPLPPPRSSRHARTRRVERTPRATARRAAPSAAAAGDAIHGSRLLALLARPTG